MKHSLYVPAGEAGEMMIHSTWSTREEALEQAAILLDRWPSVVIAETPGLDEVWEQAMSDVPEKVYPDAAV